jgi:DNA-binding GntR family transcriptional regulator
MMEIKPGQRTLRGQVQAMVRDELLSGRFEPGERINEVKIANEIGVSRGTLREALRAFEQEGILVTLPHRGTFLRAFTAREAQELQDVRSVLETEAALRVSERWNEPTRSFIEGRLEQLRDAWEQRRPFAERVAADMAFHESILEASGNQMLLDVWRSLIGNITVLVLTIGPERWSPHQNPEEHALLLESIASGDEAQIRAVYADVFATGRRAVTEQIRERGLAKSDLGDAVEALAGSG